MKTIFIDLLCPGSVIKVIGLARTMPVGKVYFVNTSKGESFCRRWLRTFVPVPVEQINGLELADERINGESLYERIHLRLIEVLEQGSLKEEDAKFYEHGKREAYVYAYRPVEMCVLAEKLSGLNNAVFVLRKTPLSGWLKKVLGESWTFFFTTMISHRFATNRAWYAYDRFLNKRYFFDRFDVIGRSFYRLGQMLLSGLLSVFMKTPQQSGPFWAPQVGVELIQSRVRLDEINDVYWLRLSGIARQSVWAIECEDYDAESQAAIQSLGVKRVKVVRNPFRFLGKKRDEDVSFVTIKFVDALKALLCLPRLIRGLLFWDEAGWRNAYRAFYDYSVVFWQSVYRQLGVRMLWSMHDFEPEILAKTRALENLDGLYVTGHWTNYTEQSIECQKTADVMMTWGPHFPEYNFNHYPYLGIFQVGYPCDHYFEQRREKAAELRGRYSGKFVLSYQDNVMAYDVPFTPGMQERVFSLFFDLLDTYGDLVIFLKPKRRYVHEALLKAVPRLRQEIERGRIVAFLGETERAKAVAAEIGMASDLCVGLGISTAAAECHFAGTVSFHADLAGFTRNAFADQGRDRIVFQDIESLKKAIVARITGADTHPAADDRSLYKGLDPFQDGQTGQRTGWVMKELQRSFQQGSNRRQAVAAVRERYADYLIQAKKEPKVAVLK